MSEKIRFAVVGLGHQSLEDHIPAILKTPDAELAAVADIDKNALKNFIKDHKEVQGYQDTEKMLTKEKIDVLVISTPHNCHYEIMKKAIEKGIHVLKEKPFTTSLEQAKSIDQLAEKNNVHIMVTLQRRFNPIYSTFFQLIDKIGSPFYIDAKYTFFTNSPHVGWRGQKALAGGGCLIDMGYHMVDLLIWYFGLPNEVIAKLSYAAKEGINYDAEDTCHVTFAYQESKMIGSMLISRSMAPKQEFIDVYGTRGMIHLERGLIERRSPEGEPQESLSREQQWPSAAQDQISYFIKIIQGKRENPGGPKQHFNHLAFIEASYRSFQENRLINPHHLLK